MIFFVCPRILYGTFLHMDTHVYETVPGLHEMAGPCLPLRTSGMAMGFCLHTGLCFANLAPFSSSHSMASPDSHMRLPAWPTLQHLRLCALTWWAEPLPSDLSGCTTAGVQMHMDLFPGATNTTLWSFLFLDHPRF